MREWLQFALMITSTAKINVGNFEKGVKNYTFFIFLEQHVTLVYIVQTTTPAQ